MGYIFISYSHKDKAYAHKLHRNLLDQGFDAWIDDRIDYGSHWPHEIENRLQNCVAFILIMSPDSQESDWVQNELSFARQLKKPIFPILLDGNVWWHLGTIQYVDVRGGKLPPTGFFVRLAEIAPRDQDDARSETEKEEKELELKKLVSQAVQFELSGRLLDALNIYYQIKHQDPLFPHVDIKIKQLEVELELKKLESQAIQLELSGKLWDALKVYYQIKRLNSHFSGY